MQRERLELNTKQSIIAIMLSIVIIYLAASWAIDSGKILPHVIAYLAAYYGIYFGWEIVRKQFNKKSDDTTSTARRAKKTHRS